MDLLILVNRWTEVEIEITNGEMETEWKSEKDVMIRQGWSDAKAHLKIEGVKQTWRLEKASKFNEQGGRYVKIFKPMMLQ